MVKGNPKSSASSATRKKHAAKKTATPDEPPNASQNRLKTKAERKLSKKEPRVKMYIPPVKPAPVQPDPLETTGLARKLPADLLVVLRNISKKAQVTKIRALEELQTVWVENRVEEKDGLKWLVEMLPVWVCMSLIELVFGVEENVDLHRLISYTMSQHCFCIHHVVFASSLCLCTLRSFVSQLYAIRSCSFSKRRPRLLKRKVFWVLGF